MAFMTFKGDKGVYTMIAIPFVNNPPLSRITEGDMVNLERHRKHGSVIRQITFSNPFVRNIIITNPDLLRAIFVGKDWERYTRYHPLAEPFVPISGGLIHQANGKEWREARELFSKTFSTVSVRQYMPIIHEHVQVLLDQLAKENAGNPSGFDVQTIYNLYTFDVISRLVFGASVDSLRTRDRRYITAWDKGLGVASLRVALGFLLGGGTTWSVEMRDKLFPGLKEQFDEHYKIIDDLIGTHIDRAQSGKDDGTRSILDDTLRSEKLPEWMSNAELKKQVIALVFAGHDTTGGTLTFATYELSRSPSWQKTVRQEIQDLRKSLSLPETALLPLEPLDGCKNLNAVIKETLRMYPAAPNGAGRVVKEDFVVPYVDTLTGEHKSVEFRKNDMVSPFVMGAGRSSENFLRPETWDPQRWIDDATGNGGAINPFANSPFGNGARKCLGERLALAQLRVVLASILEKWDIGFCDNYKFIVASQGTIKAGNGVNIKLLPISAK
ncbi:cytochrome P450 [Gonapodya prolifera JEL478]|uniref:Cytochrome P450 n=1 Tax=Gonapodya prolifera (strain JEL478) TaxID=1344416 RepID=A0A139ABK7_GONPJ|nr:cytochrome P450 [Gonapodya prolifera JEL478]|eukprot:KXS14140.1 cytochrome P450 [Gonapodya prolifera JEL478]